MAKWLCGDCHNLPESHSDSSFYIWVTPSLNTVPFREPLLHVPTEALSCCELPCFLTHLKESLKHDIKDLVLLVDIVQLCQVLQSQELLSPLYLKQLLVWAAVS